ncbi:hypothetical protein SAE02_78390 [Skermanella aerolata]|uniref:Uncharacterized protein n=1 Tax=Skermanella aerolata TaxID=393310 RepID=A0A512E4Q1_9PROT|nr:hypothetical protein SAE02_78390 [Skermanella aerolata]
MSGRAGALQPPLDFLAAYAQGTGDGADRHAFGMQPAHFIVQILPGGPLRHQLGLFGCRFRLLVTVMLSQLSGDLSCR